MQAAGESQEEWLVDNFSHPRCVEECEPRREEVMPLWREPRSRGKTTWASQWFASDPGERISVHFYDLPEATLHELEAKRQEADRQGWKAIYLGEIAASDR